MEDLDSQLIKPVPMTPFNMTDSLSPTFQDQVFPAFKDSRQYFCTDPNVQKQTVKRSSKPLPEKMMSVVKKPQQDRTTTDNNVLYRYLVNSTFFKDVARELSPDVVKQILKEGKIKLYQSGDLLSSCGKKVKNIRILLHGEVGIIFQEQKEEEKQIDLWQTLHLLVQKLGRETKNFKFKHSGYHSKNLFESIDKSSILRKQTMKTNLDFQDLKTIEAQTLLNYGDLLSYQPKYSQTLIVTVDNTLIMTLTLDEFYESLLVFYNSKQNQVIKLFRNVSIFDAFQNSKLKLLVEKLSIVEKKKKEYVYREGDQPSCFYLLIEGQVEITKTIDLLEENPNNFYQNRLKVSKERNHLNIKVLPYANFKGVYNYQQESKIINLTTIHPISVFGQEQLIQNTQREVNAKVISLTAKMYQISLSDIEDFCLKISGGGTNENRMTIMDFFALIQEGITMKKILFRQSQLSEMLHHQNKNKSKNLFESPQQNHHHSKSRVIAKRRSASTGTSLRKTSLKGEEAPPTFNNFNFIQFMSEDQQNLSTLPTTILTSQETEVMKLTHTKVSSKQDNIKKNRDKDKIIRMHNVSRDMIRNSKVMIENVATLDSLTPFGNRTRAKSKSSVNKITLDEPLFTVNYFKIQEQEQRKLFVIAKKTKLERIYRKSKEKHQMH